MKLKSLALAGTLLALQCLLYASPAAAGDRDRDPVLSDWEVVAATGRTITHWGNAWWKFGFDHPEFLVDTTGEFSALGDIRGPVFFAQGSGGEPVRIAVTVPRGQLMLLPIATYIWTFFDPCAEIRCARRIVNDGFIAGIRDAYLEVDGQRVANLASHLVTVNRHIPQVFLVDAGPIMEDGYGGILPALQGGYWAMLEPLSSGRHVLEFGATVPALDPLTGEPTGDTMQLSTVLNVTVPPCRDRNRCEH